MHWIGTSGWSYRHWKGRFYPEWVPQRQWLAYYAKQLPSVEINATFYRLQRPDTFAKWAAAVPGEFSFAFKASRYLTHTRRLRDSGEGLTKLLDSTTPLGEKRGPMLVQLPPSFQPDPSRLETFLAACPTDLRVAVEFRDPAWFVPEVEAVLRQGGAATVWSDYLGAESPKWDTAPFLYIRRHGAGGRYEGRYGRHRLQDLAGAFAGDRDVYCYFNNDADAAAPFDALELTDMLAH